MRLPAVAIAAAFACGIALGLHPVVASNATSVFLLSSCFLVSLVLILAGIALARIGRLIPAAVVSLCTWVLLGFLGACVSEQSRPPNHVTSLVEQGRLPLQTPLRWHGRMRDEPTKLPWGNGLEIELTGVEFQGVLLAVEGGLRASFTRQPDESPLPELHAGDEIAILTEAKRPPASSASRLHPLPRQHCWRAGESYCGRRLTNSAKELPRSQVCFVRCCWVTEVLWTMPKRQIFRRPVRFMCWSWLACTWAPSLQCFSGREENCV
jgi:hypothetical protein